VAAIRRIEPVPTTRHERLLLGPCVVAREHRVERRGVRVAIERERLHRMPPHGRRGLVLILGQDGLDPELDSSKSHRPLEYEIAPVVVASSR